MKATLPFINNDRGLIIAASSGHDKAGERCVFVKYSPGLLQVQGGATDGSETFTSIGADISGIASLLGPPPDAATVNVMLYNRPTTHVVIYGTFEGDRTVLVFYGSPLTQQASVYVDPDGEVLRHNSQVLGQLAGSDNAVVQELPGGDDIPPNPLPRIPILKHEPPPEDPEAN